MFALDRATGQAQPVPTIPTGTPSITWTANGLPPELERALSQPAMRPMTPTMTSQASPTPTAPTPMLPTLPQAQKSDVPAFIFSDLESKLKAGIQTPEQQMEYLRSITGQRGPFKGAPMLPFYKPDFQYKTPEGAHVKVGTTGRDVIKESTSVLKWGSGGFEGRRELIGGLKGIT